MPPKFMAHPVNEINKHAMMDQFLRLNPIQIHLKICLPSFFLVFQLFVKKKKLIVYINFRLLHIIYCSIFFLKIKIVFLFSSFCHMRVYQHRMHSHKYILLVQILKKKRILYFIFTTYKKTLF